MVLFKSLVHTFKKTYQKEEYHEGRSYCNIHLLRANFATTLFLSFENSENIGRKCTVFTAFNSISNIFYDLQLAILTIRFVCCLYLYR